MKKCIVLDLDNTLWGGVVGEDGIENIKLSLTPPGNSFVAFQQALPSPTRPLQPGRNPCNKQPQ
jgi:predicted enzyme involved in methoxymalonyl-ACP biosynthesis